jgi:argininosuccinate lyase
MTSKKLWGGGFDEATDARVEAFTESVSFDAELAPYDIRGSLAHAAMLRKVGILSAAEHKAIETGLRGILDEVEGGTFRFEAALEDVHMNIEQALTERIGDPARKLHTARSRNDQVATDLRLWSRDKLDELVEGLRALQRALLARAEADIDRVVPGFTHLQHAQPVLMSHHWLAYVEMIQRDVLRATDCRKRVNVSPLGACALAGTSLETEPGLTARELEFKATFDNSMDAVADRDFVAEHLFVLAMAAVHLSRLGEEIVQWSSQEFGIVRLPDAFSTGSSIMPQKKNPDVAELVRGKTGRAVGNLVNILVTLKGLPMTYNRDLQEDKLPLFEAQRSVASSLAVMAPMLERIEIDDEVLGRLLVEGFLDATVLAEYFVSKGMPFRRAHEAVGRLVTECKSNRIALAEVPLARMKEACPEADEGVYALLGPKAAVKANRTPGGTSPGSVKRQVARWRKRLKG